MIRLGVIGYGSRISHMVQQVFRKIEPDLRVVGVLDPDEPGARARLAEVDRKDARFFPNLHDLVTHAKPDALVIGTRCNLHASYAAQAAAFGLPVFLEKPVAISLSQAAVLEKAYAHSNTPVVVSFPLRVTPLCEATRRHIQAQTIGAPIHIHAFNFVPYGTTYWEAPYRDYSITGGLFLQKATHDFDYLAYLMGAPIVRVAAMAAFHQVFGGQKPAQLRCSACHETDSCLESPASRARNRSGPTNDHLCLYSVDCGNPKTGTNEDCSSALLEFANGAHGVYSQVFFSRREAASRGATVSGYRGTIGFDWYTNQLKLVRHHEPLVTTEAPGQGVEHFGGDLELGYDFIHLIRGRLRTPRTPLSTGLASVYACLAARDSARTGKFRPVRQTTLA